MQFQQQRAMERGIRAAKRECMMLQETGDTEGLQKASLRLRNQREKYKTYCKETGLNSTMTALRFMGMTGAGRARRFGRRGRRNLISSILRNSSH